jgi:NADH-quinone oxidoreductase subunit J
VLFLFVVALLGPRPEQGGDRLRFQGWLAAVFVGVLVGVLVAMLRGIQFQKPAVIDANSFGTVEAIAVGLFTTYLYPFELTSLLLLVAAVGAVYLSRRSEEE